ncbi:MAG TPA: 2-C-methyl-D-erythritol 4-phosphate cytidylyltransferase [Actinomycetes bacterium]|nr:2-C-methyl-D-erythritol 4-phosphate cytidylyltransferase [Actinomycetes bacterium]
MGAAAPRVAAIVPAAGRGDRLGPGEPKALRPVGGVPLLVHAVRALASAASVDLVVVAAPAGRREDVKALLGRPDGADVVVVEGGEDRQESVRRALSAIPEEVEVVLVHDAARAFAPVGLIEAVAAAVRAGAEAVVPGLPVVDTLKQVDEDGYVVATVDRSVIRAIQTPQGFPRRVLASLHDGHEGDPHTDDAGLAEAAGIGVLVVPGSEEAFKVTVPLDLELAAAVVRRRSGS